MYTLEGVSSVAIFITAYEETQWSRDSHFLICNVFVVSKGNIFDVFFPLMLTILCGSGCVYLFTFFFIKSVAN